MRGGAELGPERHTEEVSCLGGDRGWPGEEIGKQVPTRQRCYPRLAGSGGGGETLYERAEVRQGAMGVRQAKESQRRPLLASPDPATGPGEMMDAQGASRAGGRRDAGEKGRGRGGGAALTFFTAG